MKKVLMLISILILSSPILTHGMDPNESKAVVGQALEKLPLYFIENKGQVDEEVAFYVKGSDKTLYFTPEGITFALKGKKGEEFLSYCVKLDFLGRSPAVEPKGLNLQKALFNYFRGKPENWNTSIPTYAKLVYENLWPGIDLIYSGTVNQLKYEFRVKPGADPACIRLAYRGASDVSITEGGALEVVTPLAGFKDDTPYAYQQIAGERKEVSMRYALDEKTGNDVISYGFEVGPYDPAEPLVLDPAMVVYCGYIGGTSIDRGVEIALDDSGCAYVAGSTISDESSFPVKAGPDLNYNGMWDTFVAKVSADYSSLDYCGYIGGNANDWCRGIMVDNQGNAFVTGDTLSDESTFPVKVGPDLTHNSNYDGFVAKVNPQGTDLIYCGYIGGAETDRPSDLCVDSAGCAYVTGETDSDEATFPVKLGPDLTFNGGGPTWDDAFVAKVNTQGSALEYCGYIGGANVDRGKGIAVDDLGQAYVVGTTLCDESTFPVKRGPGLKYKWGYDGFVAKINSQGTDFEYCGYIGGSKDDSCVSVVVDQQSCAFVVGATESSHTTFPVMVGPDLTHNGDNDGFIAKVNSGGTGLSFCGYIGGKLGDSCNDIAVDNDGFAFVTGATDSDEMTFPVKVGPDLTQNGNTDAFVARVNPQGMGLDYCGYIGGSEKDSCNGIALDHAGCVHVTGSTSSDESTFPVNSGPDLTHNGNEDAFIAKVMRVSLTADTYELAQSTGGAINFSLDAGAAYANRAYLLLGSISGTEPGTPLPGGMATLPLNWDLFTGLGINLLNTPVFKNFTGKLDGNGQATATFDTLGPFTGGAGITLYFAFALNSPWDFASNPIPVKII